MRWLGTKNPLSTWILLCVGTVVLLPVGVAAHEEPHVRIQRLTLEIERDPTNPELYLKRGQLHRVSSHWELALADFDRVAELEPELAIVDFHRGRLLFETGLPERAREGLDRFLEAEPDHGVGLAVRGRVLRELGEPLEAARDFARAIALASDPGPGLFVEWARALGDAGGEHVDAAIGVVDDATKTLGPVLVLEAEAIGLEERRGNYDAALARVDRILDRLKRKERWLVRRAEILEEAGRADEARKAYRAALSAVESLPPYRREVPASRELEARLRTMLEIPAPQLTSAK